MPSLSARESILLGSAVFGGLAFAWMLPPTTPSGGASIGEIARKVQPAVQREMPVADPSLPATAVYDPTLRAPELDSRPPAVADQAEPEPVADEPDEVRIDYGMRTARDEYPRAFRRGYRQAERDGFAGPGECRRLGDGAAIDGCMSYFADAEQPGDETGYRQEAATSRF